MLSKFFSNLFGVKAEETKGTEERKVTEVTTETCNADFQKLQQRSSLLKMVSNIFQKRQVKSSIQMKSM